MAAWHICSYQTGKFISELNRCVRLNITAYINWEDSKSGVLSRDCSERKIIKNKDVLLEIKHPHELGIVKWVCPNITGWACQQGCDLTHLHQPKGWPAILTQLLLAPLQTPAWYFLSQGANIKHHYVLRQWMYISGMSWIIKDYFSHRDKTWCGLYWATILINSKSNFAY